MDRLSALSTVERALVVAAVLRDGPNAERILARGPDGARLAEVARDLAALSSHERARRLTKEAARLFRPTPAGIDLVHPSWIEAALAGESATVVAAARHAQGPVAAWLRKRLLGHLVAMPEGRPSQPIELADVPKLPPDRLRRLLDHLGAGRFRGRGDLLRQIAQRLPIGEGKQLLDLPPGPPDPTLLADVRAAVESLS